MSGIPRRDFLAGMAAMTVVSATSRFAFGESASPFRVSVINDEIGQDFGHVCEVASKEFGMGWIELRGMWNTCAATCPSECITLFGFSHKQLYTQVDEALAELDTEMEEAAG